MLKKNVKTIYLIAAAAILLFFSYWFFLSPKAMEQKNIIINNIEIKVEVASNIQDQINGLSNKKELCKNCGMLFTYNDFQTRNFWMHKMNFPLDIVWLKDGVVVGWQENVQPFSSQGQISRMRSNEPVNGVLELNAGFIKENNLKIGDKLAGLD